MPVQILRIQLVFGKHLLLTHALRYEALVEKGYHQLILRLILLNIRCAGLLIIILANVLGTICNFWFLVALSGSFLILAEQRNFTRLARFKAVRCVDRMLLRIVMLACSITLPRLVDPSLEVLRGQVRSIASLTVAIGIVNCIIWIETLYDIRSAMNRLLKAFCRNFVREIDRL